MRRGRPTLRSPAQRRAQRMSSSRHPGPVPAAHSESRALRRVSGVGCGARCQAVLDGFGRWQERWREPILTALLAMLALEIFVNIPLSGTRLSAPSVFTVAEFLLIISAVLVASRNRVAATAVLLSSAAAMIANVMRMNDP